MLDFASALQYIIKKCVEHGKLMHIGLDGVMQFNYKAFYIKSFELFSGTYIE